jgi:hypothetical protein
VLLWSFERRRDVSDTHPAGSGVDWCGVKSPREHRRCKVDRVVRARVTAAQPRDVQKSRVEKGSCGSCALRAGGACHGHAPSA